MTRNHTSQSSRLSASLAILLLLPAALDAFEHDDPASALSLEFQQGLISLDGRNIPFGQLLMAMSTRFGITFHVLCDLDRPTTVSFKNRNFRQALEELFGPDVDYVMRYEYVGEADSKGTLPAEVWLLSQTVPGSRQLDSPRSTLPISTEDNPEAYIEVPNDRSPEALLQQLVEDDPEVRYQALTALVEASGADSAVIRTSLLQALEDKDPAMRAYAVESLTRRDDPDALGFLEDAMNDESVRVRWSAVTNIDPARHGLSLLQGALSDPDESIRAAAVERIEQIAALPDGKTGSH
ncbi:MAG: HEAT repeat domain-containing protein [Gammaproteobacteria bacterium]